MSWFINIIKTEWETEEHGTDVSWKSVNIKLAAKPSSGNCENEEVALGGSLSEGGNIYFM